jgi:hypothetical protein
VTDDGLSFLEGSLRAAIQRVVTANRNRIERATGSIESAWLHDALVGELNGIQGITTSRTVPGLAGVDLTIRGDNGTLLVEIKTLPTNFGRSGRGLSATGITQRISSVIADLDKLASRVSPDERAFVLWIAYPIPDDARTRDRWHEHFSRVRKKSPATEKVLELRLGGELGYANVYLSPAAATPV